MLINEAKPVHVSVILFSGVLFGMRQYSSQEDRVFWHSAGHLFRRRVKSAALPDGLRESVSVKRLLAAFFGWGVEGADA